MILETADFYQTAEVNTYTGDVASDPQLDVMYKPTDDAAIEAAKQTELGKVYLDWGTWAVVRDVGQEPARGLAPPQLPPGQHWTTVEFDDLRFNYSFLDSGRASANASGQAPLGGAVYIVNDREDGGEAMNGREQK